MKERRKDLSGERLDEQQKTTAGRRTDEQTKKENTATDKKQEEKDDRSAFEKFLDIGGGISTGGSSSA